MDNQAKNSTWVKYFWANDTSAVKLILPEDYQVYIHCLQGQSE